MILGDEVLEVRARGKQLWLLRRKRQPDHALIQDAAYENQMALETREAMGALTEKWRELGHMLPLASVSRMDMRHSALSDFKDASTMPRLAWCPMSLLAFAMKPSAGKS